MRSNSPQLGKRGVALVLVVFALAFMAVLTAAILDEATTNLSILRNHASGLRALYAAQAGLSDAVAALRLNYAYAGSLSGSVALPDGTTSTYSAAVTNVLPVVTVTSSGTADGFTRTIRARLVVSKAPLVLPYPVRIVSWQEVVGAG